MMDTNTLSLLFEINNALKFDSAHMKESSRVQYVAHVHYRLYAAINLSIRND